MDGEIKFRWYLKRKDDITTVEFTLEQLEIKVQDWIYDNGFTREDIIARVQYTGLKDKNGTDIYEGDIVRWRKPYRTTQTHTGDNIPNGSYTEPMEPAIATIKATVAFKDGMFTGELLEDYSSDIMHRYDDMPFPLCYDNHYYTEQDIKDAIAVHKPSMDIWDSPEEGNLQYLLEEYNLKNIDELLSYVSGIEVIGNIYQTPNQ